MTLELSWDDGLWTLSFGLLQSHGHGSWLVCEVASPQLSWFRNPKQATRQLVGTCTTEYDSNLTFKTTTNQLPFTWATHFPTQYFSRTGEVEN
jgi:hypothetical protein